MVQIFDFDGSERDQEWLAAQYDGCQVLLADTTGATEVWRLVAVFVTEGPALFKMGVRRQGAPAVGQSVVLTWPRLDTPDGELPALPVSRFRWAERGVLHTTNEDGVHGFGLGPAYGPFYHAWVWSSVPSDCLSGVGMKGGTNHRGPLHGVWVLQDVEPVHATLADALLWSAAKAQVIEFNPSAALQKAIFASGFVPNSPEFEQAFVGTTYVAQRAEHLGTGEVRVYYVRHGDWEHVAYVRRP